MVKPDKPFKTYDQMIDYLVDKYKLSIKNRSFAIKALQTLTYYDLINGYKECFMHKVVSQDGTVSYEYSAGISLEFLYHFLLTDKAIQTILFKYSAIIENSYKGKLAYVISESFGEFEKDYLNPDNYFKSNNGIEFQSVLNSCYEIFNPDKAIPQPTNHYCKNHNHVPAWILFKNLSFSNAVNLYALLKKPEKRKVTDLILPPSKVSFEDRVAFIKNALNIIRVFRNKIAHNLKFVTYRSSNRISTKTLQRLVPPSLFKTTDAKIKNRGVNDIFALILCIYCLLEDPILKNTFLLELGLTFDKMDTIKPLKDRVSILEYYIKVTKLPDDILTRIKQTFK